MNEYRMNEFEFMLHDLNEYRMNKFQKGENWVYISVENWLEFAVENLAKVVCGSELKN